MVTPQQASGMTMRREHGVWSGDLPVSAVRGGDVVGDIFRDGGRQKVTSSRGSMTLSCFFNNTATPLPSFTNTRPQSWIHSTPAQI